MPRNIPKQVFQRIRTIAGVPGEVVFTGEKKLDEVLINYVEYNEDELFEESVSGESILTYHEPDDSLMQWYEIRGLHNTELIREIGSIFNVHPLVLEDVADTNQRPKFEEFESGNFITFRTVKYDSKNIDIDGQQVSIFFGKGFLVSFQEDEENLFEEIRNRIRNKSGRIRKRDSDYLAYTLIDAVVDRYFTILDEVDTFIENTEFEINKSPRPEIKGKIHDMRMDMLSVRKSILPLREAIGKFVKSESAFLDKKTIPFLQDVHDHVISVYEVVESQRDNLVSLQDLYMSEVSFKMNQVMQLLTVVTTIFIPLSFLTGLYGMNFVNIPELQNPNGYHILLIVMFVIAVILLILFKRKHWL